MSDAPHHESLQRNTSQAQSRERTAGSPITTTTTTTTTRGDNQSYLDLRLRNVPTSVIAAYSKPQPTRSRTESTIQPNEGWHRPSAGPSRHSVSSLSTAALHREPAHHPNQNPIPQPLDIHLAPLHFKYDPPMNRQNAQSPADSNAFQNQSTIRPSSAGHHQIRRLSVVDNRPVPDVPEPPTPNSIPNTNTHAPPNPTQTTSPVPLKTLHPAVSKVTAAALTPIQKLYEHAWFKTVNNVQTEVGRIHSELTAAADTERGRRMQAEVVVEEMRRENGVLRQECAALRARLGKVARERERDGMGVGREVEEMRREAEEKERELREERALRLSAERKLLDAMDKLRAIAEGIYPTSLSNINPADRPSSSSSSAFSKPDSNTNNAGRDRLYSEPTTLVGSDSEAESSGEKGKGNGRNGDINGGDAMRLRSPPVLSNPFPVPDKDKDTGRRGSDHHPQQQYQPQSANPNTANRELKIVDLTPQLSRTRTGTGPGMPMPMSPTHPRGGRVSPEVERGDRFRTTSIPQPQPQTSSSTTLYPVTPISPETQREPERGRFYPASASSSAVGALRRGSSPGSPPSSSHSHSHSNSSNGNGNGNGGERLVLPPLSDIYMYRHPPPPPPSMAMSGKFLRASGGSGGGEREREGPSSSSSSTLRSGDGDGGDTRDREREREREVHCESPVEDVGRPSSCGSGLGGRQGSSASQGGRRGSLPTQTQMQMQMQTQAMPMPMHRLSPPPPPQPSQLQPHPQPHPHPQQPPPMHRLSPPPPPCPQPQPQPHRISISPIQKHGTPSASASASGFPLPPPPRPSSGRRNGDGGVEERCLLKKKRDRSEFEMSGGEGNGNGNGNGAEGRSRNLKRRLLGEEESNSARIPIVVDSDDEGEGDGGMGGEREEGEVWPRLRPVRDFEERGREDGNSSSSGSAESSMQVDVLTMPLPPHPKPGVNSSRDRGVKEEGGGGEGKGEGRVLSSPMNGAALRASVSSWPQAATASASASVTSPTSSTSTSAGAGGGTSTTLRPPLKNTSTNVRVRAPVRNKLGINHMDLLYETRFDKMVCRMCRSETKDAAASASASGSTNQDPNSPTNPNSNSTPNSNSSPSTPTAPKKFPVKATWAELIGHCQEAHPKSCEELEKLSPSQVAELRQRTASSKTPGFMLK